ncbi:hypothetical protein TU94_03600 [Streptomyces cyaneogriseus subsp. noncyanogenus]|uniref:Methyltransferase domain-containing protein n=1 Tax=Streptomyces cyaneogriseus subsp. noncyanogenus TaxID=477245 RepID=A0A0C5G9F1_9ACTN|nr:hypothetical protein TU94_03600 [Streptomyces cyaneogriseus subsp. noncyanogenus]
MLDIGCGNLRDGRRFIDYLDSGNCYGIDISPDILIAAKKTLVERGLQDQLPQLTITGDLVLDFLPGEQPVRTAQRSIGTHPADVHTVSGDTSPCSLLGGLDGGPERGGARRRAAASRRLRD